MALINKNLKYLRKLRRWTQEEMAAKLGIKRSLLGAYEEERAGPRTEVLKRLSDLFHVSMDELLRTDMSKNEGTYLERRRLLRNEPRQVIEFVPIRAAAGYMAGYNDMEFMEELNTFTLPMLGSGHFRAFEINGDSMLPITSGSVIVGHKIEGWDDIKHNQSYVLLTREQGIVFKRILKNNRNKNKLTLQSDNPQFESYHVLLEDVLELWQTDAVISKLDQHQRMNVNHLADMVNNLQEQVTVLKKKIK
ncbi:MAG TPA: LexA family transcriptional regulator [Chitinophagaceae bacterium]|jgi:transcriptional regulator with XRE-family HTH domain|nr:LexA family transcriptional regulator [Chitinophagaceae bacterium]